jgi:hypothetical protein
MLFALAPSPRAFSGLLVEEFLVLPFLPEPVSPHIPLHRVAPGNQSSAFRQPLGSPGNQFHHFSPINCQPQIPPLPPEPIIFSFNQCLSAPRFRQDVQYYHAQAGQDPWFLTTPSSNLTANLTGRLFISTNVFSLPYDLTAFLLPRDTHLLAWTLCLLKTGHVTKRIADGFQ